MDTRPGVIVVGLDQSTAARAALSFALDEGLAHGYTVEIVTAWLWSSPYDGMDTAGTIVEGQRVAAALQEKALQEALEKRPAHPIISQTVVHENAERALVERAEGAEMLVVGSGRKGALTRAVLGSVSEFCVRHAAAPVVVVADAKRLQSRQPADAPQGPGTA